MLSFCRSLLFCYFALPTFAGALLLLSPTEAYADRCPDDVPDTEDYMDGDFQYQSATVYYESRHQAAGSAFSYYYCIDNEEDPRDIYVQWGKEDDPLFEKWVPRKKRLRNFRTVQNDSE